MRGPIQRAIIAILVATTIVAVSAPVLAGGWAVVRLDEPPVDIVVNVPWQFGFMVLQHDVSPNSGVTPIVRAQHQETGEVITATGRQEGPEGHFVTEVTFPLAGDWKWMIQPEPYGETSFETLTVLAGPGAFSYAANVLTGSCAELGDVAFALGDVEPQALAIKSTQLPVAVSGSTIDAPLSDLLETEHAIGIDVRETKGAHVACGDIAAAANDDADELVLGLQDTANAENVAVAVLRDDGDRTAVSLFLLNPAANIATLDAQAAPLDETDTVEILDSFAFAPYSLQIAAGDTVTWINASGIAHTVTGDDLAFDNSGPIDPGESFSLTFDEPGTYRYRCGPHPDMVGEIVVA
ncbi:MAG: cupredoxin domain-containing protein [Thermomicrobiales bacterium]